ncbi:DNA helicase OS=Streptomyces tendae OX=1932 GN=recQ PE=3 SV=1 [Streptomyces tendae]
MAHVGRSSSAGISGVGEKKLATYGEGVIAVLAGLEGPAAAQAPSSAPSAGPGTGSASGAGEEDWPEHEPEPEPDDWI